MPLLVGRKDHIRIFYISFDVALIVSGHDQPLEGAVAVNLNGQKVTGTLEHVRHHKGARHGSSESSRGDRTGVMCLSCSFCQISGSNSKCADLRICRYGADHIIFVFFHFFLLVPAAERGTDHLSLLSIHL